MLCELVHPLKEPEPVQEPKEEIPGYITWVVPPTPEQLKKKELFASFRYVTDRRQKAFLETYKQMFEEEKKKAQQVTKFTKCKRFLFKVLIGLVVLLFLYPVLKGIVYKIMGWELIIEPPTMPPPPSRYEQP